MSEIIKRNKEEYVLRHKETKEFFKIFRWGSSQIKNVLDFTKDVNEAMRYNNVEYMSHPHIPLEEFEILKLETRIEFELTDVTNNYEITRSN